MASLSTEAVSVCTVDSDRPACARCNRPGGAELVNLPCGHQLCSRCIDATVADQSSPSRPRRWSLRCPREGCTGRFALPSTPDPQCTTRSAVTQLCVRDVYAATVELASVIPKPDGGTKVMGLALLDDALYVTSSRQFLYRYDVSDALNAAGPTKIVVPELKWPRGMAASRKRRAVYVVDWSQMFGGLLWIYRENAATTSSVAFDVQPFGVSVSERDDVVTVLVTCATQVLGQQRILVYRDDGELVAPTSDFVLSLPSDFQLPRHAVAMPTCDEADDEMVVCHGWSWLTNHRVSIVRRMAAGAGGDGSAVGKLEEVATYGTRPGSDPQKLYRPLSLCVDEDGMILVADYYNHRVQLLTPRLQLVRHLVTKEEHGIEYPRQLCLDARRGLLFVGLEDGRVCIFRVRE